MALPQCHYTLPQGPIGHDFITQLTTELQGVRERKWNSERPLVFLMVILTQMDSKLHFSEVRACIKHHLKTWNMGNYQALVDDTNHTCWQFITYSDRQAPTNDSKAHSFNGLVQSSRLCQVVRHLTSRDEGGVLHPNSLNNKTSCEVSDVLVDKHPNSHQPPIEALKDYDEALEPLQLQVGYESFKSTTWKLSGSAAPSSIDTIDLQHWMFRFGAVSENLLNELILWTEWLTNASPSWSVYHAMMACRLIEIYKQPGVCPVDIGEVFRCLFVKAVITHTSSEAALACRSMNLCAGLPAGIKGTIHTLVKDCAFQAPPTPTTKTVEAIAAPPGSPGQSQATNPRLLTQPPEVDAYAIVLVDTQNSFNKLNHHTMLWMVRHRWPSGSQFAFNCYQHSAQLVLRQTSGRPRLLQSHEGVTLGDPLSMILYGIGLLPLSESLHLHTPKLVQPWYVDDLTVLGKCSRIAQALDFLQEHGSA